MLDYEFEKSVAEFVPPPEIYTVNGVYSDELQGTSDLVMASSREEAEALITSIRESLVTSGDWVCEGAESLREEVERLQKLLETSPEEINRTMLCLLGDLNGTRCVTCQKVVYDSDVDEEGRCELCSDNALARAEDDEDDEEVDDDDLCDVCMGSGVAVSRVENGKTICTSCDQ